METKAYKIIVGWAESCVQQEQLNICENFARTYFKDDQKALTEILFIIDAKAFTI